MRPVNWALKRGVRVAIDPYLDGLIGCQERDEGHHGLSRIFAGREGIGKRFVVCRSRYEARRGGRGVAGDFGASARSRRSQLAGRAPPISITENSATASTSYQMRLVLDTSNDGTERG